MAEFADNTFRYKSFSFTVNPQRTMHQTMEIIDEFESGNTPKYIYISSDMSMFRSSNETISIHIGRVQQRLPASALDTVVLWLRTIYRNQLGWFSRLPRELQRQLFLSLEYKQISDLCVNLAPLRWICDDPNFWREKARQLGVTDAQWDTSKVERPDIRYYSLELKVKRP